MPASRSDAMEKTDAATAIRCDGANELERTDCAPRTIAARSGATRHFDLEGALGPALGVRVGTVRCPDTVGPDAYPLLDVSASGAFFELPSWHTLHDRQVLDRLIVDLEGVNLYDGRAIVARTDERSGRIVCGVAFDPYL